MTKIKSEQYPVSIVGKETSCELGLDQVLYARKQL